MIKNVLRWPGGKSKALKQIIPLLPTEIQSYYCEPMLGGGSLFLYLKQHGFAQDYWINDIYSPLIDFWKTLQDPEQAPRLQEALDRYYAGSREPDSAKDLYRYLVDHQPTDMFDSAVRFFILNRMTFSGLSESGGFSAEAALKRFTRSSFEKFQEMPEILQGVQISNLPVEVILPEYRGFLFLDCPYYSAKKLYGKKGQIHQDFDHLQFVTLLHKYADNYQFLLTYDAAVLDNPEIKKLLSSFQIRKWELVYGMNSFSAATTTRGKEIFVTNY